MLYAVIISSFLLEAAMHNVPLLWKLREPVALAVIVTTLPAALLLFLQGPTLLSLAVFIVCLWRCLNMARVLKGRMHEHYLKAATLRSGLIFGGLFLAAVTLTTWDYVSGLPVSLNWHRLAVLQLVIAAVMCTLTARNILKTRHIPNTTHYSDKELPTVSVAIPARNETQDLEACLTALLANDYPKLEILVLDDCSQDKTADIIKKFAHAGVRFVKGDVPEERWLAKNQAYEKLAHEATGDLILFCGVDVRLGPKSIRALVTTLLNRKKSMVSVLPKRFYGTWKDTFIQPVRYWWELVPPRRYFNRPPVLSTCWLIDRDVLKKLGSFAAVSHAIMPERFFARQLLDNDGYSFIRADKELDVQTVKSVDDQRDTAVRMRYPQARRRPEVVFALTVFHALFILAPYLQLVAGLLRGDSFLMFTSLITCLLLIATHVQVIHASDPASVPLAIFSLPVSVVIEIMLSLASMYRYEFGEVQWKDRNICIPVMHVIPKLPTLPNKSH